MSKTTSDKLSSMLLLSVLWGMVLFLVLLSPFVFFSTTHTNAKEVNEFLNHAVQTDAIVTSVYINGFGGDPMVDYKFTVNSKRYTGFGTGGLLGNGNVLDLKEGDVAHIEYSSLDPSLSCTCDVITSGSRTDPWRLPWKSRIIFHPFGFILFLPLIGLISYTIFSYLHRRKESIRDSKS